jgi:hypothetical protein
MATALLAILREILKLLLNEAATPVKASVASVVPRKLRDAWKQRMLDKWEKGSLHSNE